MGKSTNAPVFAVLCHMKLLINGCCLVIANTNKPKKATITIHTSVMITSSTELTKLVDMRLPLCARKNGIVFRILKKNVSRTSMSPPPPPPPPPMCSHHHHHHNNRYEVWPSDEFCTRIPKRNVGCNPPNVGTPYYRNAKQNVESNEDWFEYHTDFLPEELTLPLNSGRGGFVSQRQFVILPAAAPRSNDECIERLCDLLTTSCRQTEVLLQNEIDRIIVGSSIRFVLCVFVVVTLTTRTTHIQEMLL